MAEELNRMRILIGEEALTKMKEKTVMVCGVGGVGSFTAEALARSGIGTLILVDRDSVDITNLNRQLMTAYDNVGQLKTEVLKKRLESVSPVKVISCPQNVNEDFTIPEGVDYVADCIDDLRGKIALFRKCRERGIPLLCALGSARRLSSEGITVTTLAKTRNDPLARRYRSECRREGLPPEKLEVVFLDSVPIVSAEEGLGSAMFAVGAVGLKMAEVIYGRLLSESRIPAEKTL